MGFMDRFTSGANANEYSLDDPQGIQGSVAWSGDLVPVSETYREMMILKDGSFRMLMQVGSVNFDLKGPREKQAILNAFGSMLNTLSVDSPIQILLHAAHLDTNSYTRRYRNRLKDPNLTPQMASVIRDHVDYFEEQARQNHLLDRSFYIVVSHYPPKQHAFAGDTRIADDMPGGGFVRSMMDRPGKEKTPPTPSAQLLDAAHTALHRQCGSIAGALKGLGVNCHILDELSTVRLLRELYNPGISERQKLRDLSEIGSLISVAVDREDDGLALDHSDIRSRY